MVPTQETVQPKPVVAPPGAATTTVESVLGKKKSMAFEAIEAEGQKDKLKKAKSQVGRKMSSRM